MESYREKTRRTWNDFISIFKTEKTTDNEEFEAELARIQKVEEQVRAEKEKFGASLRVHNTSGGKAKKGKNIQKQPKKVEKEQGFEIGE